MDMANTTPAMPRGYLFDERGLVREKDGAAIANFFLYPTKTYCEAGHTLPSFCDIMLVKKEGQKLLQSRIKLSELNRSWWKKPPPGCYYDQETKFPRRHVEALFQEFVSRLTPLEIFRPTVLGWETLPSGDSVYVTGDGAIGSDGYLPSDQIWISEELEGYRLETMPGANKEAAIQYFWKVYQALPGISEILLANTLAAILFPFFKAAGVESRFPIILEGPSEAKKTTLACLTSSIYNRKSQPRSCAATLVSTGRALERKGGELRHAVIVFDDLFPDGGGLLEQKALDLIRDIANQLPRSSCSGKALEDRVMECGAVITAEAFPPCGASTRTRCLRLILEHPVSNSLLLSIQENSELLGNVFEMFIKSVASQYDRIEHQITEDFREYRKRRAHSGECAVHSERLAEIGFVLYTALKTFLSVYAPDSNFLSGTLKQFEKCVNAWLEWQLSSQAMPGCGKLLSAIVALVRSAPNEFVPRQGYACITPSRLCALLQNYCQDATISVPDVIRQLRMGRLLSMDKSGTATKKIKGLGRCLCIDVQRLNS